jgi:hypothetical protein
MFNPVINIRHTAGKFPACAGSRGHPEVDMIFCPGAETFTARLANDQE